MKAPVAPQTLRLHTRHVGDSVKMFGDVKWVTKRRCIIGSEQESEGAEPYMYMFEA